ncbi:damage-inducible protein J [Opitutaceae bacterium TAV4]|nr:damage-inducible protein J [Opitutaceae bacterium TAV4]RRK00640.1 damage-inducible protein J [Opitutaceae bacterium TAV3]
MSTIVAKTTLVRARIPTDRLRQTEKILDNLGLKLGDAINVFVAQIVHHKGIPFPLTAVSEEDEIMADPEFRRFLADYKAGKVNYSRLDLDKL